MLLTLWGEAIGPSRRSTTAACSWPVSGAGKAKSMRSLSALAGKRSRWLLLALPLLGMSQALAQANGIYCTENVTTVIVHSNGNVYFQTSQTCNAWCQLNWSTANLINQGYAALLSAKLSGMAVMLYWPNISSCSAQNVVYASPDSVALAP